MVIEFDFSWLEIQGRAVKGSTLTAHKVDRVVNAPKAEDGDTTSSPQASKVAPKTEVETKPVETVQSKKNDDPEKKGNADPSVKNPQKLGEKEQGTFDFKDN